VPVASPVEAAVIQAQPTVAETRPAPAPVATQAAPPPQAAVPQQQTPPPVANTDEAVLESEASHLVIFKLDGQYYGVNIHFVESIITMQSITPLPHVPKYNIGLTNLRGSVLPVFSLRRRFGLPDADETRESRIIVIRIGTEPAGLLVDEVAEVLTIQSNHIEPAPAITTSGATPYITGIARADDRLVILLNVERIITVA